MITNGMMSGIMSFWMILNILFWILFIVGFIVLIFWIFNKTKGSWLKSEEESALDILKKRYARGEINKEEFEERKRDLL